ncbi:MAG: OprO/OprP family phosphate-selective porin [Candidatus Cloacimonetes bacterium]|nr:OprO/OprP family phosphate-selective porin [Candidatus Cloacimonadota bacterium]
MVLGSANYAGFWAQLMYMTPWNLQPIVKYEQYDPDTDKESSSSVLALHKTTTFGINYYFNDWTRLQLNYLYKAEEDWEEANDEILMQLQVKF